MKDLIVHLTSKERTWISSALCKLHAEIWDRLDLTDDEKKERRKEIEDIRSKILDGID